MSNRRFIIALWAAGLVFWVFNAAFFEVSSDDHWWHLLTGKVIVETGQIPHSDPFSYTFFEKPWVNWEWGSGLVFYLAWLGGGPAGMFGLRVLLLFGIVALMLARAGRLLPERERLFGPLGAAALILCLTIMFNRFADRPHALGFLMLALTAALAESAREGDRRWPFVALVPITALWVNLHPSFLLGLVVVGAAWLNDIGEKSRARGFRAAILRSWRWPLTLVAMLAASFINPYAGQLGTPIVDIFAEKVSPEWNPLFDYVGVGSAYGILLFIPLVLLTWGAVVLRWRERPFGDALLFAALGVLGLMHTRFIAPFAVLAFAPLLCASRRIVAEDSRDIGPLRVTLTAAILALGIVAVSHDKTVIGYRSGIGVDEQRNPVGALDMAERLDLRVRSFPSSTDVGAYIAWRRWPAQRDFIDGRVPQLFPVSFLRAFEAISSPQRFLEADARWGFGMVVIGRGLMRPGPNREFAAWLSGNPAWALVYFDEQHALFLKCAEVGAALCEQHGYTLLDPTDGDLSFLRRSYAPKGFSVLLDELRRAASAAPQASFPARVLLARLSSVDARAEDVETAYAEIGAAPDAPTSLKWAIGNVLGDRKDARGAELLMQLKTRD